jgi:alpha/beta superfamily hydrolase
MIEYFTNARGVVLAARKTIHDPSSPDIYVLCHGLTGSMDFDFFPELSARLPYNTFRFDFTGNGLSQGEFSFGEYSRDVEDLRDAVTYLRSQGLTVKGVAGHSKAAAIGLMYNQRYGDVPLTIAVSGRFYMQETPPYMQAQLKELFHHGFIVQHSRGRDYRFTLEAFLDKTRIDMQEVCRHCTADVIVIHGEQDRVIHVKDAYATVQALGSSFKMSYFIPEADHVFTHTSAQLIEAVRLSIESYFLIQSKL